LGDRLECVVLRMQLNSLWIYTPIFEGQKQVGEKCQEIFFCGVTPTAQHKPTDI
jgi:hypothetical protein